jgi:thiol-disulfide isomerase/thioredoxin
MRSLKKTLGASVILIAVFSVSFLFFYKRTEKTLAKQPLILTPAVINQPLPNSSLINLSGQLLDDEKLRHGRVVLVFTLNECPACDQENEFLKTVVANNRNVRFFGVIPFGQKDRALKTAQSKYAFETFFDQDSMLSRSLQIYQVPIKIFVDDGIIKRVWLDATTEPDDQAAFKQWLNAL